MRSNLCAQGNDTDSSFCEGAAAGDGSGGHTFMARVNGAPILGMGSNIIPLDEMEGRLSEVATRNLVQSMVAASYT